MTLALLFDLDGTLIKSDPLHVEVFIDLYRERGREIDEAYYLRHIHGGANVEIFSREFPDEDAQALSEEKEARFRDKLGGAAAPMPGLPALMDRADREGWPRALVTNAPRKNAEAMLDAIGLRDRMGPWVIGDEMARPKPDPLPYVTAMEQICADPRRSLAFEDSPSGVRAARGSGARVIGVRSSLPHERLVEAGAHVTIEDYADPVLETEIARLLNS